MSDKQKLIILVILWILSLAIIFIKQGHADLLSDTGYCSDANTLVSNVTVSGNVIFVNSTCAYGCNQARNICNPNPYVQTQVNGLVPIIYLILPAILMFFASQLKGQFFPLQLSFVLISLFLLITDIGTLGNYLDYANQSAILGINTSIYFALIGLTAFGLFFYIIYFIFNTLQGFGNLRKTKKP